VTARNRAITRRYRTRFLRHVLESKRMPWRLSFWRPSIVPPAISPARPQGYEGPGPVPIQKRKDCPDYCFQGSTEFYNSPEQDEFTPSYLEARPLVDNVGRRSDGSYPVWMDPHSHKPAAEQYVEWFNGIWHTGDPTSWNESVFTNLAVMIDPSGISKGAKPAAANFILLFKYFPELRGEVVSWAANEREILINWRFRILRRGSKIPLLVPVVDKFCFVEGRVSFRLATFDILTFIGYLSENFGNDQLYDYISANLSLAQRTGGIQKLQRMLWNLAKGLFVWQSTAEPTGLVTIPGDGVVLLRWAPVEGAISYKVTRAESIDGDYVLADDQEADEVPGTTYTDVNVVNGRAYWYLVSPNLPRWRPVPPVRASFGRVPAETAPLIAAARRAV
jgi:hypothetical protein